MPDTIRTRSSQDAALPYGVTDPLLWRAAYDVAANHRPDAQGRCSSLLCAGRPAPCEPLDSARRAMRLAGDTGRRAGRDESTGRAAGERRRAA
ncbi:hypothetical protein O7602_11890 [Micromonospora sp. WMMD1128]|uniref:hypothetical protein n=1 Tax=unclassified Micromonospora TaxID=2617518 RepID=UPI00248BC506|nr:MULTISPECIES: hypothetical protein [unclassified Micromonospora]WBB76172.1 hypothetical protein O7602_11890 [Micromonospora sp. WMMD1128]WFE36043.1 hypothetical protein O7613_11865 [Micromonospora sp. WMMD975]